LNGGFWIKISKAVSRRVRREGDMPTISMFYGIIVRMLFLDIQQHHLPHNPELHYERIMAVYHEVCKGSLKAPEVG
jgi:hypothetical protein